MTNERIDSISRALMADESKIAALFALEPAEAAEKLAAEGYDFTAEELVEYAEILESVKKKAGATEGELDESALEDVAGGGVGMALLMGIAVGYFIYEKKW